MENGTFITSSGVKLNYVLQTKGDKTQKRPMLVYLHGADGKGDDYRQILNIESIPNYIEEGKLTLDVPCIVLAPQCPDDTKWSFLADEVTELIDRIAKEENADEDAISLTGCSLGGMGTLDIAIAYPEKFSCIVPVCASVAAEKCDVLKMPVWIFHGELDRGMGFSVVAANCNIKKAGGNSKLTLLENEGHEIRWIYYDKGFDVVNWMLAKRRA